jgi:hypothetical protein
MTALRSLKSRRGAIGLFFWLSCCGHSSNPALAWGRLGQCVISRLAEQRLTDKAKAGITASLPEGETLADASLWASIKTQS